MSRLSNDAEVIAEAQELLSIPSGFNGTQGAAVADITVTFTTDDPAVAVNGAIVIADGDATVTGAVVDEVASELAAKINAILASLRTSGVIAT